MIPSIKKAQASQGFTLVELIVVITILAILGTIGFISLQGYSANSRDTKRTNDLRALTTAISVKWNAVGILNVVSSVGNNELTTPSIGGSNATVGTNYRAGTLNYTILDQNGANFKDPSTSGDYIIGVTTRNGGNMYQLAARMEAGGSAAALVTGNFVSRAPTFAPLAASSLGATITAPSSITLAATDVGKVKVGDLLTLGGTAVPATAIVTTVSSNQLIIGLTPAAYTGIPGTLLYTSDTAWLIDATGVGAGGVVTNGGSLLPY